MEAKVYFCQKKYIKIFHNDSGVILLNSQRILGHYSTDFFHTSTYYSNVHKGANRGAKPGVQQEIR